MTTLSPLVCRDATHYNSHQLAAILTECFTDYVIPFTLDGPIFATRFNAEGLSLTASRIWSANNNPVALAIIVRRGSRCRLAAFAIHPRWRRGGLGKAMLGQLLREARQRGDSAMWLGSLPAMRQALPCTTEWDLYVRKPCAVLWHRWRVKRRQGQHH
ncbi:MAG: GNAT family N-acetyltransferase [Symbiopectobacterium sp.]|uniref:GNAT family N-acetyltransferase n=1 Tax=Symbiopectobacterium sp. TaxID=2952789 RepID=UPI0039E97730